MLDDREETAKAEALRRAAIEEADVQKTDPETLIALKHEYDAEVLNIAFVQEWYEDRAEDGSYENGRELLGVKGRGNRRSYKLAALDAVYDKVQDICGKIPHTARKYGDKGEVVPVGLVASRQLLLCEFLDPDRQYNISNLQWLAEKRRKKLTAGSLIWPDEPEAD